MTTPSSGIRRLIFDLETSPNVALIWRPGTKISVSSDAIVKERGIICMAWMWEGESEVHSIHWNQTTQDDARVVKKAADLFAQADEIVAHNGDRFDIPWVRGRCLKHGYAVSPRLVSQDTCQIARRLFNLNSNSLDYIAGYLGLGTKAPSGYRLWRDIVMKKCRKSMERMVNYCVQDVKLLADVWAKIKPYAAPKSHTSGNLGECPECGSKALTVRKRRITAAGTKQLQLQCGDCGKYHSVSANRYAKIGNGRR